MDVPELLEPRSVVAPEIREDGSVLVQFRELADDLHGQHLSVIQKRIGATLAQPPSIGDVRQGLINQAIHPDNQLI